MSTQWSNGYILLVTYFWACLSWKSSRRLLGVVGLLSQLLWSLSYSVSSALSDHGLCLGSPLRVLIVSQDWVRFFFFLEGFFFSFWKRWHWFWCIIAPGLLQNTTVTACRTPKVQTGKSIIGNGLKKRWLQRMRGLECQPQGSEYLRTVMTKGKQQIKCLSGGGEEGLPGPSPRGLLMPADPTLCPGWTYLSCLA